jgi:type IV pilus assembly protein PilY1
VQGWLDAATITRLNTAAYGNLDLASHHEVQTVSRPAHNRMPHVFVGAPSSEPFRWILGFEDLNGGGDRDFNDVVFLVNRQNVGVVTSGVVSSDISPSVAPDYTITTVKFTRDDDATTCTGSTPCYHEDLAGACSGASPSIEYDVAVDCRICSGTTCTDNPNPTWTRVVFPDTNPPTRTAELNMLDLGFTGSQLCWRAQLRSSNQYCRPTINNIDVNYQALKAGRYSRSAVTPVANAIFFASREVPGQRMTPGPSTRLYDNRKDFSLRGHLSMQSLYEPENPTATHPVLRWDAGKVMSDRLFGGLDEPRSRNLYTVRNELLGDYQRVPVSEDLLEGNNGSRAFPTHLFRNLCGELVGGRYVYDLNRDGVCDGKDRLFLKDWLYGYEDGQDPAPNNVRRPWPMGGVDQSTPAFVGPAGRPGWWYRVPFTEQQAYDQRYLQGMSTRASTAFVGTVTGFLHAFNAGSFRTGDDRCTPASEVRGYFERTDATCGGGPARAYGSGRERYAYLPGSLLSRYINHYVAYRPGDVVDSGAAVNASPTVADVDLGGTSGAWTPDSQRDRGAKTVLVSTTGKTENTVFALDVTRPDDPVPLWEYTLNQGRDLAFSAARLLDSNVRLPDTRGSRHSPAVVRMRFAGTSPEIRWVAVVATDYQPNVNTAGTVYFLDMATGRPVGTLLEPDLGVVTLELNEGIGGEPSVVDVDQDGVFDVVYVPSTTGRVWRINPGFTNGPRIGQRLAVCKVADVPADLAVRTDAHRQRLHSPVAARVVASTRQVRLFMGTGDDPDRNDPTADNYHLMAYVDTRPLEATCTGASTLWKKTLPAGERVWGGMVANETDVYTTTAVGNTVQPCDLSSTQFGAFYAVKQEPDSAGLAVDLAGSGTSLGGHGLSVPVLHDNHLFIASVEGQPLMVGNDQWNNRDGGGGGRGTRVLMFEVSPDGRLPR